MSTTNDELPNATSSTKMIVPAIASGVCNASSSGGHPNTKCLANDFFLLGASVRSEPCTAPAGPAEGFAPPLVVPAAGTTDSFECLRKMRAAASNTNAVPDSANFLVWDTETSGIGSDAVVVQLAWVICSETGDVLKKYNRMWKLPPRHRISWKAYTVHKISEGRVKKEGVTAATELSNFVAVLHAMRKKKLRIVAHNAAFDMRMLQQTARAHGITKEIVRKEGDGDGDGNALCRKDFFCTMNAARDKCGLRNCKGRRRPPSNTELYKRLIGTAPNLPLHDASADILVTAASYAAGKRKRWW